VWPGTLRFERSPLDLAVLQVHRERDVRDAAAQERRPARQVRDVFDVRRPHDANAVFSDVGEDLVEFHVLLRTRADQVVIGHPGDRQHGRSIELGIVEPVDQVQSTWAGRRQADAEPARELRIAAGHERGGLLMAHLDEADGLVPLAKRFHDPVDPVARKTKDGIHAPLLEHLHQNVSRRLSHSVPRNSQDYRSCKGCTRTDGDVLAIS
jgi:hypothetical protein